jgi:hypothetical protein
LEVKLVLKIESRVAAGLPAVFKVPAEVTKQPMLLLVPQRGTLFRKKIIAVTLIK